MRPAMKRPMQRTPTSNTLKTIPTALDPRTTKLSPRPGVFNLKQLMFSGEQMSSYRTSVCTFPLHSIYTLLPVWLVSATFLFCLYCLICLFLFVLLLSWSFVLILSGCVVSKSPLSCFSDLVLLYCLLPLMLLHLFLFPHLWQLLFLCQYLFAVYISSWEIKKKK